MVRPINPSTLNPKTKNTLNPKTEAHGPSHQSLNSAPFTLGCRMLSGGHVQRSITHLTSDIIHQTHSTFNMAKTDTRSSTPRTPHPRP
jgi:hypothetical protein